MRRRATPIALSACVLGALAAGACGGGQTQVKLFTTNWQDDGGRSIEEVRRRIEGGHPTTGVDVAIGVAGNADKIIGVSLAPGGAHWTFAHPLDARPVLSTSVVVGSGGGEVFALDAATGHKLWARPTGGLQLHAAGDDGAVTVVTLSRAGAPGTTLYSITHDGGVLRQLETETSLGAPAVVARLAFIPWGNQYVTVFDPYDGSEVGRLLLRDKTSRAWTVGGGLYFGEVAAVRFDERIKGASRSDASRIALPPRELPGTPTLMVGGDTYLGPVASAPDRIRLYARPSGPTGPLSWDSDRFYATYFGLVMGFTANKGALRWVHTHSSDVLGGAAAKGALIVCDEQGKVTVLDAASGATVSELDLGEPVKSCAVQADGFRPATGGHPQTPAMSLAGQIEAALESKNLELATAQRLLLRELGTMEDEQVTKTLVDVASDPRTSPALLGDARSELASRHNGASFMLEALGRHYDFLKGVLRPPPVGPIAQALASMKETSAAPLLASHLFDPADTDDDVRQAASALVTLAGPGQVPELKRFFAMYRAAPEQPEAIAEAVASAGQALLRVGGLDGRATVDRALAYPMTNLAAKERLSAMVHAADAEGNVTPGPLPKGVKK
jgi:outer membrane protein assembly factor BamB